MSAPMIRVKLPTPDPYPADIRVDEPHKRLMVAVLQTAVDDCRGSRYRRAAGHGPVTDVQRLRGAVAYVTSRDRAWPFSFENLCESLRLDAGRLRQALQSKVGS